jgi:hypothetical protein
VKRDRERGKRGKERRRKSEGKEREGERLGSESEREKERKKSREKLNLLIPEVTILLTVSFLLYPNFFVLLSRTFFLIFWPPSNYFFIFSV